MDDNKRDYDDFFKSNHKEDENRDNRQDSEGENRSERPSYYYSYGPYKSGQPDPGPNNDTSVTNPNGSSEGVEMTPPRPVRPLDVTQDNGYPRPLSTWAPAPRKRSSLKSGFAAFLAGAVVVGSLMFASDKMNLFSDHQALVSGGGSNGSSAPSSTGVKTSSLDVARPSNISQMVQQASPAVVLIETYVKAQQRSSRGSILDDPFFRQFFGSGSGGSDGNGGNQQQQPNNSGGSLQLAGEGSGFFFEKSGYILTNQHVVDGADEIKVTVQGYDQPLTAKLLGNTKDYDLAVLKVEGTKDFPVLPIGNANDTAVGDWVVAIGNPYGYDHSVTVGVLSAKERPIEIQEGQTTRNYKHLLQTDASINPGNSGGPLLNLNGEVIGINTAVNAQAQGIGFAIPTSTVQDLLDKLKNNVAIPKEPSPYIGVSLQDVNQADVKDLGLSNTDGAEINTVQMGSPAFKAGLRQYDVILSVNGAAVKNSQEAVTKIKALKVGDKVTLNVMRDGKKIDVPVTIGDMNNASKTQPNQ